MTFVKGAASDEGDRLDPPKRLGKLGLGKLRVDLALQARKGGDGVRARKRGEGVRLLRRHLSRSNQKNGRKGGNH